ncbi:MAG: hypothetical protein CR993_08280 [Rhodobacterales bacterium]|nr:MAG: hypothetical protein CR993_08280 [Rhodobacterales bacterium]
MMTSNENIDISDWILIEEKPELKRYQKDNAEKRIRIFETYTIEENYIDNQLNGLTVGRMNKPFPHFPNKMSKVYLIETYENGVQENTSFNYYDDGSWAEIHFKNGEPHGKYIAYFGNGQKEKERNNNNGELDGIQYEWFENGQLKIQENYKNGILEGESLQYLENGLLKQKKHYKNGIIEGVVYTLWDYKGSPVEGGVYSETEYKNDIPHGRETVFFANGNVMREGYYKNAKEEGERVWYNANGTLSMKENFVNGKLNGERFLYDAQGNLESIQKYINDERIE